jgi:hypothetical protein
VEDRSYPIRYFNFSGFFPEKYYVILGPIGFGAVAELADAGDLKSSGSDTLWVQFPPAPCKAPLGAFFVLFLSVGLSERVQHGITGY